MSNLFLQAAIFVEIIMPNFLVASIFPLITGENTVLVELALFLLLTGAKLYVIVLTKNS